MITIHDVTLCIHICIECTLNASSLFKFSKLINVCRVMMNQKKTFSELTILFACVQDNDANVELYVRLVIIVEYTITEVF